MCDYLCEFLSICLYYSVFFVFVCVSMFDFFVCL